MKTKLLTSMLILFAISSFIVAWVRYSEEPFVTYGELGLVGKTVALAFSALFVAGYFYYGRVNWIGKIADFVISISQPHSKFVLLLYAALLVFLVVLHN